MRSPRLLVSLPLLLCAVALPAQQVALTPDSLTLAVGDTSRVVATLTGATGLRLSYRGTNATAFTTHLDGRVTARAPGCGYVRVGVVDSTWSRAQVRVCVVAAAPAPAPAPAPVPDPAPPPTGDVDFLSDWSTALGNTRAAITDGGRWPVLVCDRTHANVATVVAGAPLGFTRTPHVLRMQQRGPNDCAMLQVNDVVPVSTTHWGRFYIRNDENGNSGDHPTGYNNAHWGGGAIQAVPLARESAAHVAPGTWRITVGGPGPYPFRKWWGPALQNGVWYRYEWEMRYLGPSRFQFWPRVYDASGALVADADDFVQEDAPGAGTLTLAAWLGAGNSATLQSAALARHFGIGHEGTSGTATMGYWYYARFAMSTTGWIGP